MKKTITSRTATVNLHAPIAHTLRGFGDWASFTDTYGAAVAVRDCSSDPLYKVWVFVRNGVLPENDGSIRLNVRQATKLATALLSWVAKQEEKEQ
jgi:hypothetical protein